LTVRWAATTASSVTRSLILFRPLINLPKHDSVPRRVLVAVTGILIIVLLVVRNGKFLLILLVARGDATADSPLRLDDKSVDIADAVDTRKPKQGDVYAPGWLPWTRVDAYRMSCVDPCKYRHHFSGVTLCNASEKYNLTYYMIGKAARLTRRPIKTKLLCWDRARFCVSAWGRKDKMTVCYASLLLRPYSRFLAGFHEALFLSFKPGRRSPVPEKNTNTPSD
jgi:hypothetical protein